MQSVHSLWDLTNCPVCRRERRRRVVEGWREDKLPFLQHMLIARLHQVEQAGARWIRQRSNQRPTLSHWEEYVLRFLFVLKRLGISDDEARDDLFEINCELLEHAEPEALERLLALVNAEGHGDPDAPNKRAEPKRPLTVRRVDAVRTGAQ